MVVEDTDPPSLEVNSRQGVSSPPVADACVFYPKQSAKTTSTRPLWDSIH